jgi:hypothetical protein
MFGEHADKARHEQVNAAAIAPRRLRDTATTDLVANVVPSCRPRRQTHCQYRSGAPSLDPAADIPD